MNIILGDLVNDFVSGLAHIFTRYHTIMSCTGFFAGAGTQLKLANVVLQAGVKRNFRGDLVLIMMFLEGGVRRIYLISS